jgi:chromosome segregation ATPase
VTDGLNAKLGRITEKLGTVEGKLVEAMGQIDQQNKANRILNEKLSTVGAEGQELRRSANQRNDEIKSLELHRMVLGGLLVLAIGVALVGFVRKPKPGV